MKKYTNKSKLIKFYKQTWAINMQTQTAIVKPKRGGPRPGAGRPVGYQGPKAIKRIAIKTLQKIMQDETASAEARALSASKLLDVMGGEQHGI
ncbi:hypothetical protein [Methylobacter sp.]|uniref:hypothetical protein n=1 Tax=Methylobacter sp. TaxID=2051955 RepID=UPI002FDDD5EC